MTLHPTLIRQRLAVVALLLGAGLAASAHAGPAGAMLATCRTDPVIVMSNGRIIDLTVSAQALLSELLHVTYVLHGPADLRPISVLYPDGTAAMSTFTYVPDAASNTFSADVSLSTTRPRVAMTAYLTVAHPTDPGASRGTSASGTSASAVHASITADSNFNGSFDGNNQTGDNANSQAGDNGGNG